MKAAWLIGSLRIQATNITVTANSETEAVTIPAGNYYLWDNGSALCLATAFKNALESHSEIGSATVGFVADGRIRVTANVSFAIDSWSSSVAVRNALGFTTTTSSATSVIAPQHSPLWWSPGKTESPDARLGSDGNPVLDTAVGQSGPGTVTATQFNEHVVNRFRWFNVLNHRVRSTDEDNGEHFVFWRHVLSRFVRWKMYRNVDEVPGSTTPINLSSYPRIPSSGAYIQRATQGTVRYPYARSRGEFVERYNDITIHATRTVEYA